MKTTGRVNGIISNIVIVKADGPVGQNEICHVYCGDTKMMAEVIKVVGDNAYVQVFDSTRGLKIGEKVEFEGHMLEATLAPGLLSRNYDGLQNDLEKMDGLFIARGSITDPIDFEKKWEFKPLAKPGDKVSAASWLGQVKEEWVEHKIMVPFTMEGTYRQVVEGSQKGIEDRIPVTGPNQLFLKNALVRLQGKSPGQKDHVPFGHVIGLRKRRDDNKIEWIQHDEDDYDHDEGVDPLKHPV